MSEVYRARIADAIGPERPLVVKIAAQSVSDDPRASARFLDEANLALALSHGNISSAFEFGKADGRYFIVMEYIRGASVRQLIEAARKGGHVFPLGCALAIAVEVARALQYAHTFVHPELGAMPLVHRDVNPSNVLVARDGQVKLTDFGIAHALGRDPSHGIVWGQAHYVAPELLEGGPAGPASDLFALGAVLYHMLTLEPPFRRDTEAETLDAIRAGAVPSARSRRAELPGRVDEVLSALLAPTATARPASAEEARRAIEQLREVGQPEHGAREIAAFVREILGAEPSAGAVPGSKVQGTTEPTVPLVTPERASVPPVERVVPSPPVPSMPGTGQPRRGRASAAVILLGTALVAVFATAWVLRAPPPDRERPTPRPQPAATKVLEPERPVTGTVVQASTIDDPPAVPLKRDPVHTNGPGGSKTKRIGTPALNPEANPVPPVVNPASSAPAVVTVNSWPWSIATVDGRRLPGHTPLRGVELAPGPHTFLFENPELRMRRAVTVTLGAGERRVVSAVLEPQDSASP